MRLAFLIKLSGKDAELVAHGPVTEVKPKFVEAKVKDGDELILVGPDIRTKRRGKSGDIDAYLAVVEKENADMRAKAAKEAEARAKQKAAATPQPPPKKSPETEKILAKKNEDKEAAKASAQKELNKK